MKREKENYKKGLLKEQTGSEIKEESKKQHGRRNETSVVYSIQHA